MANIGNDIFHDGVNAREKYLSRGAHYLMNVITRLGYRTMAVYSCKIFVEELVDELQCDVQVTFEDHPDGIGSQVKRIHKVSIFSDKVPQIPITGSSFDEDSVFMLEDIRVRCIVSVE